MGSSPLTRGKPRRASPTASCTGLIPAHAGKTCRRLRSSPHGRAHPRSRGENASVSHRYCVARGSSPLTRGKHAVLVRSWRRTGLIPAHAGKTEEFNQALLQLGAHPRSRGENGRAERTRTRDSGSSPLTRGKRRIALLDELAAGLIPAHAGKTRLSPRPTQPKRAHPRSRGENAKPMGFAAIAAGSSPLTRGKPACTIRRGQCIGLIPAHAGKTVRPWLYRRRDRAHPRSRGENRVASRSDSFCAGSSPLTRGKLLRIICPVLGQGLIPAHAGKTCDARASAILPRAHPRSRGENAQLFVPYVNDGGSSPLTRGKRAAQRSRPASTGLIPAHAGKTRNGFGRAVVTGAHPRSRGENTSSKPRLSKASGSSPLTRGKRERPCQRRTTGGLIPAHAGKTGLIDGRADVGSAHPRSRGENFRSAGSPPPDSGGSSPLTRGKRDDLRDRLRRFRLIPAHAGKTSSLSASRSSPWAHPRSRGENQVRAGRDGRLSGSSPLTRGKRSSSAP